MRRASGAPLAGRIFGRSPAQTLALLQAAWPLAVGAELARRTRVVAADGGTLRVRVPDAGWRKVLHRMQPDILSRLRDVVGDLAPRRLAYIDAPFPAEPPRRGGAGRRSRRHRRPPPSPAAPPPSPIPRSATASSRRPPDT